MEAKFKMGSLSFPVDQFTQGNKPSTVHKFCGQ